MAPSRLQLDELIAREHGVVSVQELEAIGYRRSSIDSMVRRQVLRPILPGVYHSPAWPPGLRQRLAAICKRNPAALISHTTAGHEWGLRKMSGPGIHVLVPEGSSPTFADVTVHRCRQIDPVDIVRQADGVRLTSPPRTLFDASSLIGVDRAESALEHLLDHQMCTIGTVAATVERLARGGRPGSSEMRTVLARRPAWTAAVQSDLELRMVQALRRHGLPEPVRQQPIVLPNGNVIHPDLTYPQWRLVLEIDHPYWHLTRAGAQYDKVRDRQLAMLGWRVIRLSDWDVERNADAVVAELQAIIVATSGDQRERGFPA